MADKENRLTVLFVTLDGYGHLNSCIGVAEQLAKRGHRAVFALERAWRGKASKYPGLEEALFVDPKRDPNDDANAHWIKFMDDFKKCFCLTPKERFELEDPELAEKFFATMLDVDQQIKEVIEQVKPDVIVVDSYTTVPAVFKSGIPWVWLTSSNPLSCLPHDKLPPHSSGLPTNCSDKEKQEFLGMMMQHGGEVMMRYMKRLAEEFDLPPLTPGELGHRSPYLNMYAYPKELDYLDIRPLPPKWQAFDHFIRFGEKDESFKIPEEFLKKPLGKLIYVSMGSMGCAHVELMKRLIGILGKSPNRFIYSLGPRADQMMPLPENSWGAKFVPQTQILPMVDMVITHGGNNTVLESLYFGKPMIVCPLFGDQFDNAVRITECGFGTSVNPLRCEPEELLEKIETVLKDEAMAERLKKISERLQQSQSTEKAAEAIEKVAKTALSD